MSGAPDGAPAFSGVYLFVRDIAASVAFYERLGFAAEPHGADFARIVVGTETTIEMGIAEITRRFDPGWREQTGPATNILNFDLASAAAVDAMYADLVAAGYAGHLAPFDAFWGARYAMVDDPDGNVVGLHGPRG